MEQEVKRLEETVKFCCIAKAMRMHEKPKNIVGIHARQVRCNGNFYNLVVAITKQDIENFQSSPLAQYA